MVMLQTMNPVAAEHDKEEAPENEIGEKYAIYRDKNVREGDGTDGECSSEGMFVSFSNEEDESNIQTATDSLEIIRKNKLSHNNNNSMLSRNTDIMHY